MKGVIYNVVEMKKQFLMYIERDKKSFKNITIYYESMSEENTQIMGFDNKYLNVNCCDGYDQFLKQKTMRESHGYIYSKATDCVIGGIKLKRYIIKTTEKYTGDHLGLISGYLQADNEVVCYAVRF